MSLRLAAARIERYRLPLLSPVAGRDERIGWWIRLVDDAGRIGAGEAACWPGFGSSEAEVEAALHRLLDGLPRLRTPDGVREMAGDAPEACFGFELAMLDLMAQSQRLPLARVLNAESGLSVPVNALVADVAAAQAAVEAGYRTLKIKLPGADVARVAAIREAVGPDIELRVDANRSWSSDALVALADGLTSLGVQLVEEPTAEFATWPELPAGGLRWAADESVVDDATLEAVVQSGRVGTVVLKPMFLGMLKAWSLGRRAQDAGLDVIVTHALDSAVGRAGASHLAAALGLQTASGLSPCLGSEPLSGLCVRDGELVIPDRPGLGVRLPSEAPPSAEGALAEYAVPHPVESNAQARPSHPAVVVDGREVSWRTLCDRTRRAATALRRLGLGPGDAVSLVGTEAEHLVRDIHAVSWTGAALSVSAAATTWARVTDAALTLEPAPERFWPLDEVRIRVTTSGTTGEPKVVNLTTGQLVFSAFGSAIRLEHRRDDRWLCCLPLNHVGGLSVVYRTAFYATTMALHDGFDVGAVGTALDSGEVTQASLVPTMLRRLLEHRDGRPFSERLRLVLLGGGPADDELLYWARAAQVPVAVTYGMTETASQVATLPAGDIRPAGEVGPPLPFVRVSTRGPRLTVRGPVARGEVVSSDRGHANRGGVRVEGRADDAILSGGELVDPKRIESVLLAHPQVSSAAVVGLPDPDWGQRVEAVVVASEADQDQLRVWCRDRLARFEVPKHIHFVDTIPRGALGKVSRARVRATLAENRGVS